MPEKKDFFLISAVIYNQFAIDKSEKICYFKKYISK